MISLFEQALWEIGNRHHRVAWRHDILNRDELWGHHTPRLLKLLVAFYWFWQWQMLLSIAVVVKSVDELNLVYTATEIGVRLAGAGALGLVVKARFRFKERHDHVLWFIYLDDAACAAARMESGRGGIAGTSVTYGTVVTLLRVVLASTQTAWASNPCFDDV